MMNGVMQYIIQVSNKGCPDLYEEFYNVVHNSTVSNKGCPDLYEQSCNVLHNSSQQ